MTPAKLRLAMAAMGSARPTSAPYAVSWVLHVPPYRHVSPTLSLKVDQAPLIVNKSDANTKTAAGDLIRREVTVFWSVEHGSGSVTTGWNYKDGSGGVPVKQYCYYAVSNGNSTTRVDIASDKIRLPHPRTSLVPDLEVALAKCQWWHS